jgi:hypothetical protein
MRSPTIMLLAMGTLCAAISGCGGSLGLSTPDSANGSGGKPNGSGGPASGSSGGSAASNGSTGRGGSTASASGAKAGSSGTNGNGASGRSGATSGTGASSGSGGKSGAGATASGGTNGGSAGSLGSGGTGSRTIPTHCTTALPSGAQAADVSHPTTVVGTGTAASCTFGALDSAVKQGGVITFNCGSDPVTIGVTATMVLKTTTDTVIDGGNTITLDGGNAVQILNFNGPDWMKNEARVTLQHLTFINAKTTPTQAIPTAPAPCSQGFNDGEGGAVYVNDGNLTVIDCTFSHNEAAQLGPDTGGGAIYITGSKHGALIVGSVFTDNSASNAGAVGGLFAELDIYDSLFQNNTATGNGANSNDASMCSAVNNNQHEIGSGGNGGAIYQDGGASTNVVLCGIDVVDNKAGMGGFGGGVFMTSNDFSGTITVQDSTIMGNTGGSWTQAREGSVTNLGSAFGVNAKSAAVLNSMLQGR